jgi:hypothetical protein
MPESERERRGAEIAGKWAKASQRLDERARRIWLGAEAEQLGPERQPALGRAARKGWAGLAQTA